MNTRTRSGKPRSTGSSVGEQLHLPAPSRGVSEEALERMKQRLLDQLLEETPEPELWEPLIYAASEAAALAWMTPFPLLVLPVLMIEKAQQARLWMQRQRTIIANGPYRLPSPCQIAHPCNIPFAAVGRACTQ